jgi:hypothetical protein
MAALKQIPVDLGFGLQGVASVDEHRRRFAQDDRHSGRPGKPRQPGQAFRMTGHVLPLVLVTLGNDEPVQATPTQLSAQGIETLMARYLLQNIAVIARRRQQTGKGAF